MQQSVQVFPKFLPPLDDTMEFDHMKRCPNGSAMRKATMTTRCSKAMDFLLSRRSRPFKILKEPVPEGEELERILTAAVRTPDHGALEPWRLIVIGKSAMPGICTVLRERGEALGKGASLLDRAVEVFANANLIVAVVASPDRESKIPAIEQTMSAGAVCLSLLNAALASGWGANWLTGFGAHDPEFRQRALGLSPDESIAGFIHLGTGPDSFPDRPRPGLETLVTRLD